MSVLNGVCSSCDSVCDRLCCAVGETMPCHAGGWQGVLPEQQEFCQRPQRAGPPLLQGRLNGGEWNVQQLAGHVSLHIRADTDTALPKYDNLVLHDSLDYMYLKL